MLIAWFKALGKQLVCRHLARPMENGRHQIVNFVAILLIYSTLVVIGGTRPSGHYLSASAQMWASTHNDSLKETMFAVVSALSTCQDKIGSGYLSAFSSEFFDRAEALQRVWAPYYTIHKIMAGLLDQHLLASNPHALKMLTSIVDYFYNLVQNVIVNYSLERHWISLNREFGGMNDLLYTLYTVTVHMKTLPLLFALFLASRKLRSYMRYILLFTGILDLPVFSS